MLKTPYLQEIHMSPDEQYAMISETVKCVAHAYAVEGSKQQAPAGLLACTTLAAMDPWARLIPLEPMGVRVPEDEWPRSQFWNRSYQRQDGLESPRDAVVGHLATLIGE